MQGEKCMQLVGNPEGKYYLKYLTIDGRIILKWVLKKWDVGLWAGFRRAG
jgi:hypothetical protein